VRAAALPTRKDDLHGHRAAVVRADLIVPGRGGEQIEHTK
jgi:hypothetical protein